MSAYAIITPVRNEEDHFPHTLNSVCAQTVRPLAWVIVNDGSTDATPRLAEAAAGQHGWIRVVHRPDRGRRKQGGGVIEAFNDGYALLSSLFTKPQTVGADTPPHSASTPPWSFLVKLDGDLQLPPDYFARCLERFADDSKLGIGGGMVCRQQNGDWVEDSPGDPPFHVRGATKIYRRACWEALGGLVSAPGWDTLDELKANMLGWQTYTFREIKLLQLKFTGAADGAWKNWVKNGLANYNTGYHPLFMLAKCLRRFISRPFSLAAPGLLAGFFGGYLKGKPAGLDTQLVHYIRRQQMNCLLFRDSLWKPRGPGRPAAALPSPAGARAGH